MEEKFNTNKLQMYREYADCFTTKICLKDGRIIKQNFLGALTIKSEEKLRIGIDQSSSQTGVAVKTSDGKLLCLIDFVNTARLPYPIYRSMLGMKIEQLFFGTTAEICVVEKMWGGNTEAYEMLSELAEFLKGFKYLIPGWSKVEVAGVLPNVWRKGYFKNAPEYKGMYTKDKVKLAAKMEGIKRYPFLAIYGEDYEGRHINDSFDALGIIEGYESLTFSEDGEMRRVAKTMTPTNHKYTCRVFGCPTKEMLMEKIQEECPGRSIVEYEYNEEFPYDENMHRATSLTNKIVFMRIKGDVALIQMMWMSGATLDRDRPYYIFGWRDTVSTKLDSY